MQQAGGKDWRMWEAKLKMLGLNPASKIDVDINYPRKDILSKYMGDSDARQAEETKGRPPTDPA
jgi:hypothetical protein